MATLDRGGPRPIRPALAALTLLSIASLAGQPVARPRVNGTVTAARLSLATPPSAPPLREAPPSLPLRPSARFTENSGSICSEVAHPDRDRRFVSRGDLSRAAVDGGSLDAVVSRGAAAALPSGWAPDDLVELPSHRPITARECAHRGAACLRRAAAAALAGLLAAMRRDGVAGQVHSSFRSYDVQCMVFRNWAYDDGRGFCRAVTGSALPGHSQHQLGTTVDLLAARWRAQGRGLSQDFGCSPGGRWLAAHAEEHGFVLPYPLHPDLRAAGSACEPRASGIDPRTGYAYEPWHLRYVGAELVREFSLARAASAARHRGELALDQWLRHRAGRPDDGDLPVCDGCACGACSTLEGDASRASAPCARDEMLSVRADGSPTPTPTPPALVSARAARQRDDTVLVTATVRIAEGTVTQTPAAPRDELRFASAFAGSSGSSSRGSEGLVRESTRDLPGAYRLAIEPIASESATAERWPFRVGLASGGAAAAFNSAALYLPARAGVRVVRVVIATSAERVRVALLRDGAPIASSAVTELRVE